jgi:hypothetical protein
VDRTARQSALLTATSWGGGNSVRMGFVLAQVGGSGSIWDRVYTTQNTVDDMVGITGGSTVSGSLTVIQGWYLTT